MVSQTVLSFIYQLAKNSQSFPIAFVFRTENPNKFRKAEREAEVKFVPKVKPNSERNTILIFINACIIFSKRLIPNSSLLSQLNCLNPISNNNVKIQLNLRAKLFSMLNNLTRSQRLRSPQSSKTENVIGRSRSNYGGGRALKSMSD